MALQAVQVNVSHYEGRKKRWRVFAKKQTHRKLRRSPIEEEAEAVGMKTRCLPTSGWLY